MLTVNHTDINHVEHLYSAAKVEYDPSLGSCEPHYEPSTGVVNVYSVLRAQDEPYLETDILTLCSGCVYVMNEQGNTIAKYALGGYIRDVPTNQETDTCVEQTK